MPRPLSRLVVLAACCLALASTNARANPGETSGVPLDPLLVTHRDAATGDLRLAYQSGCDTTDNNIYVGRLEDVSSLTWSGEVCGIGTSGVYGGFNPGPGSYFFLIVGNDGVHEGSYGRSRIGGSEVERPAFPASTCQEVQDLTDTCLPAPVGAACSSSADCLGRQACLTDGAGSAQCGCLAPFGGEFCEDCAPGYAGPDCRECAPGFVSNAMQQNDGGDLAIDTTDPERLRCEPDVPGDCSGRTCSGHGDCTVSGRDAICACDAGYAGEDCEDCAPNHELDAAGRCVLGEACGEAKCGGHGDCLATPFGDVTCACDIGYTGPDCGGPALEIEIASETRTLYDGQSLTLEARGGSPPYTWQVVTGPARVVPCDVRLGCTPGTAELTIEAPAGGLDELELVKVTVADGPGVQTAINLAAIPQSYLPITGELHIELAPFYGAMLKYMRARGIRGGVLGISKGGTIIATNGYGYRDAGLDADPFVNTGAGEIGPLVQPDSPFRIASVTKPLTAAAVRDAAADAGVNMGSAAASWIGQSIGFNLINGVPPYDYNLTQPPNTDNRWSNVTIQRLLNHHVGFWQDSTAPSTTNQPNRTSGKLPLTVNPQNPNDFQPAVSGWSTDISYATMFAVAAMQLTVDPRPTPARMIRFVAGNTFDYPPGGNTTGGNNYANIGYIMAGRVLEGLRGESYDPDLPGVPMGWGPYPNLLQDYLCEASGIQSGVWPGDNFNPRPGEPYYRDIDQNGNQVLEWNLAQGADRIRFDNGTQTWEFCEGADCPNGQDATWSAAANTPSPYGGIWLAQRNSAGGLVATTSALLRFARNHRIKVGTPNEGASGTGSLLDAPGSYGSSSLHSGSLVGTRSWLWQMGGFQQNNLPDDTGAWNDDPAAPLDLDNNGNVIVSETLLSSGCMLPSDVAVAVMFNQRQDRRAPDSGSVGATNTTVYGRITDFLGDATCKVDAQGWPQMGQAPAQIQWVPVCD